MLRARVSAAISFCVRGSSRPSDGGGAKCSTANGAVRMRASVAQLIEVADDGNDAVRAQPGSPPVARVSP